MIDLHAHVLPGLDDGPADLTAAMEMVRAAVGAGVSCLAATSHYSRRGEAGYDAAFAELEPVAREAGIRLIPGMEYDYDRIGSLAPEKLRTLGDSNYLLIDLKQHIVPPGVDSLFFRLTLGGRRIVVAHPERLFLRDTAAAIQTLSSPDVFFQLNSGSILGRYGRRVARAARWLMDHGFCHLIADDVHHAGGFRLKECRETLLRRYSPEVVSGWLEINPARLLENRALLTFRPPKGKMARFREWLDIRLGR